MVLTFLLTLVTGLINTAPVTLAPSPIIRGDYVEARTASVFAGPCHYNGEVMTCGTDAILAWHVNSGSWQGVDLSGVRAMAAITSDSNLAESGAARKSEIVIDSSVAPAQSAAMLALIKSQAGESLGNVISVRSAPIKFVHYDRQYRVSAADFAAMDVQGMPNDECCKQPNLVWYTPLVHLDWRKVGYSNTSAYTAGTLTDPWQRADENDAFYGTFTIGR
jgi:hypothetical protein